MLRKVSSDFENTVCLLPYFLNFFEVCSIIGISLTEWLYLIDWSRVIDRY